MKLYHILMALSLCSWASALPSRADRRVPRWFQPARGSRHRFLFVRGGVSGEDRSNDEAAFVETGEARVGFNTESRGLDMDVDVNVDSLVGALGRVSEPLAVVVRVAQASLFYGAPMLALGHFYRNSIAARWAWFRKQLGMGNYQIAESDLKLSDETSRQEASTPPAVLTKYVVDYRAMGNLFARGLGQFLLLVTMSNLVGGLISREAVCGGRFENMIVRDFVDLVFCISTIFFGSRLGGLLRFKMDMNWYRRVLKKPTWTPPPPAFPLIWTPLFTMQGVAFFYIWKAVSRQAASPSLLLFFGHKTLGDLWNRVFFGEKRVGAGLSIMYMFYGTLAAACYAFYAIRPTACYLLLPTAAWVFVATALNFAIWLLNGTEPLYPYTEVIQYM